MKVSIRVNGTAYERDVEARTLLAYFLREQCGLTGTHVGCDTSSCGCCVVVLDGNTAVKSCTMFAVQADGHDVLTVSAARKTYDSAKAAGVDATLRILDPDETGAEHCQHDNPTIGQEILSDWLADKFGIDQGALLQRGWNPLL